MVKEHRTWKFQQVQFQFDLDLSWLLGSIILLSIMLLASILRLLVVVIRKSGKARH